MDCTRDVFKMLGIKPNEEFKVDPIGTCLLDNDLQLWVYDEENKSYTTQGQWLNLLLIGAYPIVKISRKINPTKEEQLAINYAEACGYKWLAKDELGEIYAFISEPYKVRDDIGYWNTDDENDEPYRIKVDISFLDWDDNRAYHIGDMWVE